MKGKYSDSCFLLRSFFFSCCALRAQTRIANGTSMSTMNRGVACFDSRPPILTLQTRHQTGLRFQPWAQLHFRCPDVKHRDLLDLT